MKTLGLALSYMSAIFIGGVLSAIPLIQILAAPIESSGINPVPIGLSSFLFYLLVSPALSFFWAYRNRENPSLKGLLIRAIPMALVGGALMATMVIAGAWIT